MRRQLIAATVAVFAWPLALLTPNPACAQHGWPIAPPGTERPIGNSFGEFQDFSGIYQHTGIDILTPPMLRPNGTEDPAAPWVITTVGGTVTFLSDDPGTRYNGVRIRPKFQGLLVGIP